VTQSPSRAVLRNEILLVLGVSLGQAAVSSILSFIDLETRVKRLSQATIALNPPAVPDRPWLDLANQLYRVVFLVVPALLALHLLNRTLGNRGTRDVLGLNTQRWRFDLGTGAGLAAVIGIPGLGLYLAARALGLNANLAAATLSPVWWSGPVLTLLAIANAVLEEVVVVGYLMTRLREIGWATPMAVAASALLRGSYHLYQGFGGFVGNAVMGVIFALFFVRFKRIGPLIIAHSLLDIVAFVGYTILVKHHVSWL
jgi:membrane protease YdiL (CAAX protease family)